jgi:hypothetical protein
MLGWKKAEKKVRLFPRDDKMQRYSPECPDTLPAPARADKKPKRIPDECIAVD